MAQLHTLTPSQQVREEAVAWLIKLDGDTPISDQERQQLTQWLSRSSAHRQALRQLNRFWSDQQLTELMVPLNSVTPTRRGWWWQWPQLALPSLITIAVLLVLANSFSLSSGNGLHVTAVGQQKLITLDDGSQLQLNTNSQVQVDYRDNYRNIRLLQGEVHFDVHKDPQRPFRVYAGSGRVQALGTAFNIYLDQGQINVFVTEGRVDLANLLPEPQITDNLDSMAEAQNNLDIFAASLAKSVAVLDAGQSALLAQNGDIPPKLDTNLESEQRRLAWRQGLLIFSGETLAEVVAEVSRYTTMDILVDKSIQHIQIGGQIPIGDTQAMFAALETNFNLKVRRLGYNQVQVIAANQEPPQL